MAENQNDQIKKLEAKLSEKDKTIDILKAQIAEFNKSEKPLCQNGNCKHFQELESIKTELELNIVDSKIKMVDIVDRVNDLQYRNDRLENILAGSPQRYKRLVDELDRALKKAPSESEDIRRSMLLMRTLSEKLSVHVPESPPECYMANNSSSKDILFEGIIMRLEEFRKIFESCSEETIGKNFCVLSASISKLVSSIDITINGSKYLRQKLCFMRASGTGGLSNISSSRQDKASLALLKSLFCPSTDSNAPDELKLEKGDDIYHPFFFCPVSKVNVTERVSENDMKIVFSDKKLKPTKFGAIRINRKINGFRYVIKSFCMEVFRLFNQIWRFKNYFSNQTTPEFSVYEILALDSDTGSKTLIENTLPLSALSKTRLNDFAREAITQSVAGTVVGAYVLGIEIKPQFFRFTKKGKIYLLDFDSLFGCPIVDAPLSAGSKPKIHLEHIKMFFPGALLSYFGRVGTSEMNAACIVAFLNLRKYSGTVIRFVKMMFGNCYDSRDLEKFVSMMLMADAEFKEVEKNIKKTIKTSSKYYQRLLLSLLEQ